MDRQAVAEAGLAFSAEDVSLWRKQVAEQRDLLFRRNWKNQRPKLKLKSKGEVESFAYIVEWCEEFDEVVGREKERRFIDQLIADGKDVNAELAAR